MWEKGGGSNKTSHIRANCAGTTKYKKREVKTIVTGRAESGIETNTTGSCVTKAVTKGGTAGIVTTVNKVVVIMEMIETKEDDVAKRVAGKTKMEGVERIAIQPLR